MNDRLDAEIAALLKGDLVGATYPGRLDHAAIHRRAASLTKVARGPSGRWLVGAAAATIVVAVVSVGLFRGLDGPHNPGSHALPVRIIELSQATSYGSLGELAQASDTVVLGVPETSTSGPDPQTPSLPRTSFTVRVESFIKGSGGASRITVLQTGGPTSTELVEVHDDPLMLLGNPVVLFLDRVPGANSTFMIVGGPQGRLLVHDQRVTSLPAGLPGIDMSLPTLERLLT
jgi:hypothetical protein